MTGIVDKNIFRSRRLSDCFSRAPIDGQVPFAKTDDRICTIDFVDHFIVKTNLVELSLAVEDMPKYLDKRFKEVGFPCPILAKQKCRGNFRR